MAKTSGRGGVAFSGEVGIARDGRRERQGCHFIPSGQGKEPMQSATLIFVRQHDRDDWFSGIARANHQFQAHFFGFR